MASRPCVFRLSCGSQPDQFALVCAENSEAVLELAADGSLVVMTPTGSETGARTTRLEMRLLL
jgi:Uma2 family endonuclease